MIDLESFLDTHRNDHLHIEKPVPLDHIPALTAEAGQTIVFENIDGYPDWRLVDQLFVDRAAQGRVLGCAPSDVVPELAAVLKRGPRPLVEVDGGPCQEVVIEGDDVDLAMLPIVTHTDRDPYPYTTSFAIHRDPGDRAVQPDVPPLRDAGPPGDGGVVRHLHRQPDPGEVSGRRGEDAPGDRHRHPPRLGAGRLLLPPPRRLVGARAVRVDHRQPRRGHPVPDRRPRRARRRLGGHRGLRRPGAAGARWPVTGPVDDVHPLRHPAAGVRGDRHHPPATVPSTATTR